MANDPSGILLPPGMRKPIEPMLVTMQVTFRVDAPSKEMAENIVMVGTSFNARLGMSLLAHGVSAEPFTKEAVERLGFNMEDIERDRPR